MISGPEPLGSIAHNSHGSFAEHDNNVTVAAKFRGLMSLAGPAYLWQ
jgi:hypothetical protein